MREMRLTFTVIVPDETDTHAVLQHMNGREFPGLPASWVVSADSQPAAPVDGQLTGAVDVAGTRHSCAVLELDPHDVPDDLDGDLESDLDSEPHDEDPGDRDLD